MFWSTIIPFILSVGPLFLAGASLHKDWHNYRNAKLRAAIPVVLVLLSIFAFISQSRDRREKQKLSERSAVDMGALKGQVKAANDAQAQNTTLFLASLSKLSAEVRELQIQVKTEALQKRLMSVQAELENTRKA